MTVARTQEVRSRHSRPANIFRYTLIYVVASFLWILFSDRIVLELASDPAAITLLSTIKGWAFVAVTAALIYGMMRHLTLQISDSEAAYEMIFSDAADAIIVFDRLGAILDVNGGTEHLLGFSRPELLRMRLQEIVPADEQLRVPLRFEDLDAGRSILLEREYLRKDGTRVPVEVSARPLPDGRRIAIIRDITVRRQNEELIRNRERHFRALFERHHTPMLLVEPVSGIIVDANAAAVAFYGYSRDAFTGMDIAAINILPVGEIVDARRRAAAGELNVVEFPHRLSDGTVRTVEVHSTPIELQDRILLFSIIHDITERKRVEEELRQSEERNRLLIEKSPDAILLIRNSRFVFANPTAVRLLGAANANDIVGTPALDMFPESQRAEVVARIARAEQGHENVAMEMVLRGLDGREIRMESRSIGVVYAGQPAILVVSRDIRERREQEEDLLRLRKAVAASNEVIFLTDVRGLITFINPAFTKIYGFTAEETVGRQTPRILKSGLMPVDRYAEFWKRIMAGETISGEMVNRAKNGQLITIDSSASPITDERGAIVGFLAIQRDITERKRVEEALRQSEAQNRAIIDSVPDLLFRVSKDGVLLDYRAPHRSDLYAPEEAFLGRNVRDVLPPHVAEPALEAIERAIRTQEMVTFEYELEIDGTARLFEDRIVAISDTEALSVIRDITERRRTEEALRESEDRFSRLAEASFEGIAFSEGGFVIDINEQFARMLGYDRNDMIGMRVQEFVAPESMNLVMKSIRSGSEGPYEHLARRRDGSVFAVEARARSLPFEGRNVRVTTLRDISDRKRLEEHVRQSQKMESLGLLAGGVAHDFNNILNIIMGNANLIASAPEDREKLIRRVDAIAKATERGARVVHQLLAFARKTDLQRRPLLVNDMVWETCRLLEETFPKTIDMLVELTPDLPVIAGDANQLQQVLLNLSVNARDAMPNGGTLAVRTDVVSGETLRMKYPQATTDRYVRIIVTDTGTGMEENIRTRVFDPFFTTKDIGKGTGLGLAVALGIVERHGGFIDVDSTPGQGTEFRISLPAAEMMTEAAEEIPSTLDAVPGGTETILFVEDEHLSREMIRDVLEQKGYRMYMAGDGEEALRLYRDHSSDIDLVITDLGLPKSDGEELCRQIRQNDRSLPLAVASGFVDPDRRRRLQELDVREIIMKPYQLGTIVAKIRALLDARVQR